MEELIVRRYALLLMNTRQEANYANIEKERCSQAMQEHKLIVGHMSQNTAPFSQRVVALQIERRLQSSLVILF